MHRPVPEQGRSVRQRILIPPCPRPNKLILILVLVAIRLVNRLLNPVPSLPNGMPGWQRFVAHTSHVVLYALMFTLPLVGLGDAVCGAISHRPLWAAATATDSAA
jgi:cytochrome b561